jgi:PAS domain S-box-containing protein
MLFDGNEKAVDYRFLEVNTSFENQTGIQHAPGRRMREIAPLHEEHWFEMYGKIALTGEPARFENQASQLHRWYDVYAFRVGDPQARHVAIHFKDITERKRAEEEKGKLTEQLQAANKELEAFSYSVSHDLRAPLRGIDGFSQALLEDYEPQLDDQGKDYLRRVRAASQRMAQLIDDMLNLSRVTRSEMQIGTVDLSGLVHTLAAELQTQAPDRQVTLTIQPGVTARGDGRLLRQVMDNLLGNAWKFTSKQPAATIEFGVMAASSNEGAPAYFLRDNGAGLDMAYAEKLFSAFQRLHAATEFPGTGIGLAIVQRIIHRHGGRVWAESAPGRGATFYFTLS